MKPVWFFNEMLDGLEHTGSVQDIITVRHMLHQMRPCVWLKARITKQLDEKTWAAYKGGLIATGKTPEEAMDNFDKAFYGVKE